MPQPGAGGPFCHRCYRELLSFGEFMALVQRELHKRQARCDHRTLQNRSVNDMLGLLERQVQALDGGEYPLVAAEGGTGPARRPLPQYAEEPDLGDVLDDVLLWIYHTHDRLTADHTFPTTETTPHD